MPPENIHTAINACAASEHYAELFRSLAHPVRLQYNSEKRPISNALFYHLVKMRHAGWVHRVEFARARKHSISDIFQDLLAFYFRCTLPEGFDVHLEASSAVGGNKKTQADILIKKGGKNHFIIEAKTTIGYSRPDAKARDPYETFSQRINLVAENFDIPSENVIYIFEEPSNVSQHFRDSYWNPKSNERVARDSLKYPMSRIYPLFWGTDPYYWRWDGKTRKDQQSWYPILTIDHIAIEAEKRIVTPFETVVDLICRAETVCPLRKLKVV